MPASDDVTTRTGGRTLDELDTESAPRIVDRSAAKARLLTRWRDETAGPPTGVEAAVRCSDHGRFIVWCSPPAPPCRVACPPECGAPPEQGPALHARAEVTA